MYYSLLEELSATRKVIYWMNINQTVIHKLQNLLDFSVLTFWNSLRNLFPGGKYKMLLNCFNDSHHSDDISKNSEIQLYNSNTIKQLLLGVNQNQFCLKTFEIEHLTIHGHFWYKKNNWAFWYYLDKCYWFWFFINSPDVLAFFSILNLST